MDWPAGDAVKVPVDIIIFTANCLTLVVWVMTIRTATWLLSLIHIFGVVPNCFLKLVEKWDSVLNPVMSAISEMCIRDSSYFMLLHRKRPV